MTRENQMTNKLDTVKKMWKHQFGPWDEVVDGIQTYRHPYTCENRDDGNHLEFGGDVGVLVPTINGWMCPCCKYTQSYSVYECQ